MGIFFIILGVFLRLVTHFDHLPIVETIARFVPHLPNFAPIAAMALFGGVYLAKKQALIIPLVALFLSDLLIGFYNPYLMVAVYGSFLLIGLLGLWLRRHKTVANIAGASLLGSIGFFLITNFAMWAVQPLMPHSIYPQSLQGLLQCYTMGLPFFRNTLLGDMFYTGSFFGLMELTRLAVNKYNLNKERHVTTRMERERI